MDSITAYLVRLVGIKPGTATLLLPGLAFLFGLVVRELVGAWLRRGPALKAHFHLRRQEALLDLFSSVVKYDRAFGTVVLNGGWPHDDESKAAQRIEVERGRAGMAEARKEVTTKLAASILLVGATGQLSLSYCDLIDRIDVISSDFIWSPALETRIECWARRIREGAQPPWALNQLEAQRLSKHAVILETQRCIKQLEAIKKLILRRLPSTPTFRMPKKLQLPSLDDRFKKSRFD